jgi:transcriptional regulator of acetoin/glycerol metabolism
VRARGFAGRHCTARIPAGQRRRPSGGNLLKKTLAQTNWNKSHAARRLGLSRQGLLKKIKRYGIARDTALEEENRA